VLDGLAEALDFDRYALPGHEDASSEHSFRA
jgi:hypothetical protein